MFKKILSKRLSAISIAELSENVLVKTVFGAIVAVAVVGAIAYFNNQSKINDASIYATTLNWYLQQEYNKAQSFWNDFYINTVLNSNGEYVEINDQKTKQFYKYPIAETFITATGSKLGEGSGVNMTWTDLRNGQVAIGLFTTSSDLTDANCGNYVYSWTYSYVMNAKDWTKANAENKSDICKGYDDTVSQIIIAGNSSTIKSIKNNVYKTASNVDDITVYNWAKAFSWLVVTLR